MAKLIAVLVVILAYAASAVQADVPSLQGRNVKVICGYGNPRYPQGWTTRYHRDPGTLLPVFVEILDELGANKMAPGSPLYKGSYIMRFTVEAHEGASQSNRLDVGWGNRTGGTTKPVTATVRVVVRQMLDNNGTESAALASSTGTATAFSGNTRTNLSLGRFQGRPFRTSSETRVSPKEAEYAAIAAALREAACGLTQPIEVRTPTREYRPSREREEYEDSRPRYTPRSESDRNPYDYYRDRPNPQPRAEESEEEDVLVAPLPKR